MPLRTRRGESFRWATASCSKSAADLYDRLEAAGLVDCAENMYELYHVEAIENTFADLDHRLAPAAPR